MERESQILLTCMNLLHLHILLDPSRALARQVVINEKLCVCMQTRAWSEPKIQHGTDRAEKLH